MRNHEAWEHLQFKKILKNIKMTSSSARKGLSCLMTFTKVILETTLFNIYITWHFVFILSVILIKISWSWSLILGSKLAFQNIQQKIQMDIFITVTSLKAHSFQFPWLWSLPLFLPSVWPWMNHAATLCLSCPICESEK